MTDVELLRHTLATLAYRAAKTMRGAPASFADFKPGPTSKTPVQIVAHMGDLSTGRSRWCRESGSGTHRLHCRGIRNAPGFSPRLSDLTMHSHPAGLEWNLRNGSRVRSR